jgi:hypothetical protein
MTWPGTTGVGDGCAAADCRRAGANESEGPLVGDYNDQHKKQKEAQAHQMDVRHPPGAAVARLRALVLAAVKDKPPAAARAAVLDGRCARRPSAAGDGGSGGMAQAESLLPKKPKQRRRSTLRRSKRRIPAEQFELQRGVRLSPCSCPVARLLVMLDGLMVTADLGEVGGFELQGEVHQRVGDVSGGFIGDGVFRQSD